MTARMFDYPTTPTERAHAQRIAQRHQLELFATDPEPTPEPACPVCAGTHTEADCPHGTAPTLPETRNPSNPTQVRAMFRALGWPTTGD
jgi:hypothetical protein